MPMRMAFLAAYCSCYLIAGHAADEKIKRADKVPEKNVGASKNKVDSAPTSKPMEDKKSLERSPSETSARSNKKETESPQAISVCEQKPHLCNDKF